MTEIGGQDRQDLVGYMRVSAFYLRAIRPHGRVLSIDGHGPDCFRKVSSIVEVWKIGQGAKW